MTFDELSAFIRTRMRMSRVYQAVMLMTLLEHKGESSVSEIARSILNYDESQKTGTRGWWRY
jgi:hypothetical protein